jgi:aminomethyltransferase
MPSAASLKGAATMLASFVIPGGGRQSFQLRRGDEIVVTDPEGLQPAEIIAQPVTALSMGGLVGFASDAPGRSVSLVAAEDATCTILAPGEAQEPDAQAPPTDIHVTIASVTAHPATVPEPLAVPRLDLRIRAATAEAYRVKAGEYIQIIDVEGRQCSDFLAFDAAKLAAGIASGLDPTVTRTLGGASYPTPGLHAKFFDAEMQPLVEVIRDTVGRHDTFMLACAAKYYDDMGYPGHANCTDNFNAALRPFGIPPRAGWPAINFFYNTIVGPGGAITLDEPWSRPGDYVLLRALTDLVCATSSCADDIDPANAWFPTDIHLRIYDAESAFSRGIAHRMTPDASPRLTRESGFHSRTSALTREFVEYRGFWLPSRYRQDGPIAEYWACRERACLVDLSALRKFEVVGPDAEALLQAAAPRDIAKLAVGQVVYTAFCYPHGGMLDDGTIFRLGRDNFRVVCGEDYLGVWLRDMAAERGWKVWVKSATDQLHNVALQGPLARDILAQVVVTPPNRPTIAELGWFRLTVGRIGGPEGPVVMVSRTGYTGELGYEIWCHPDRAPEVWDALWAAGAPLGMVPAGLDALEMLRIEAGLIFAGHEFGAEIDPFEAGIGFSVPAKKTADYLGAEALARRRANPMRVLVGLDIAGNEEIGHGDPVHVGRAQIGVVTSAARSPMLGRSIALARLDVAYGTVGTAVEIGKLDGQQKRIGAEVTGFPHYDPQKTRVRA